MNRQIVHLFTLIAVLFGMLVVFHVVVDGVRGRTGLEDNTREPAADPRGPARSRAATSSPRDGTRARAQQRPAGAASGRSTCATTRRGSLFAHAIGYSFIDQRVGLERSRNDELTGEKNEFVSLFEELVGHDREGDDVHTNLDPEAQRVAIAGARRGRPAPSWRSSRRPGRCA